MTTGTREIHDFCFINLMTRDAAKAKAFYGRLFGWTYGEMPGVPGGHLILVDGHTGGALMDLEVTKMPPGTPAVIGVMIRVESADATVAKVNALGGRAEPAFDVLENGRMAMCTDPQGAVFGVWQAKKEAGIDADSHGHGAPGWFEVQTSDAPAAVRFYTQLFGWATEEHPMGGFTYTVFKLGNRPVAGAMPIVPQMGDVPPNWATNFSVKDAAEAERLAAELGAKVLVPTMPIPNVGRFAFLCSPQGVPFYVIEWAG
jgi:predicted enzyme related to lactoylglutathione lyase